jgi:hypothetical protein
VINAPAWFNEQNFVNAAREHFLSLQQHWDANEMDKISEFVTPQLFEFLQRERAEIGDAFQSTYVDDLQIQLDGVDDLSRQDRRHPDLHRRVEELTLRPGRSRSAKAGAWSVPSARTSLGWWPVFARTPELRFDATPLRTESFDKSPAALAGLFIARLLCS